MSQHLVLKEGIEVQIGYDTPCDWFYMVISKGGDIVYSNLYEPNPKGLSLTYFVAKAKEHGIEMPGTVIDAVLADKTLKRMNNRTSTYL